MFKSQMSTSSRGMFTAHYKKHYVDSEKNNISTALFDWGAEGERHRHGEKTWRRETRHIDLKGFSPYIAVRSTLQPPLEREHVVNTSSSGQSLLSDFTLTGCIRACNQKLRCCFKNVNECWKALVSFFSLFIFLIDCQSNIMRVNALTALWSLMIIAEVLFACGLIFQPGHL